MARLFAGTQWDQPPICDRCGQEESDCQCPAPPPPTIPPEQQTARVAIEKRKKGKRVTVVRGLPATGNDLPALLQKLKNACGAGGTIRDDQIEIQGDHAERVSEQLREFGFRVR